MTETASQTRGLLSTEQGANNLSTILAHSTLPILTCQGAKSSGTFI